MAKTTENPAQAPRSAPLDAAKPPPQVATLKKPGTMPVTALLKGYHARRESWKPGAVIYVALDGGRGGGKPALKITGSRSGDLPWSRPDDHDLLAEDWIVIDPGAASA